MKKLTIIEPYSINVDVEKVKSIYNPNDKVYITSDPNQDFVYSDVIIRQAKNEVEFYKKRYDNILRGLAYWKARALRNG